MAETVRDVLIKLKIQQEAFSFTLPDTKAFEAMVKRLEKAAGVINKAMTAKPPLTQGTEAGKAASGDEEAKKSTTNLAEQEAAKRATADKAFLESLRQQKVGLEHGSAAAQIFGVMHSKLSDEAKKSAVALIQKNDALRKSAEQSTRSAAETKRMRDEGDKLRSSLENQQIALKNGEAAARIHAVQTSNLSREAKKAAIALIEENEAIKQQGAVSGHLMASADGMKMMGEGAAALGRGLMVLTAASDEEIQILARKFLMYTAFLDVFKGATDLIKGMIVVNRSLVAAHAAATVAAGVHTVATTGLTGSLIAARTAALAMWVALGPLGWAVLATIAAVTLGVAAWNHYRDAQKASRDVTVRYMNDIAIASHMYNKAKNNLAELTKAHQEHANKAATSKNVFDIQMGAVKAGPVGMGYMTERDRAAAEIKAQEEVFAKKHQLLNQYQASETKADLVAMGVKEKQADAAVADLTEYEKTRQGLMKQNTFSQRSQDVQQTMINQARQDAHENPNNPELQTRVLQLEERRLFFIQQQQAQTGKLAEHGNKMIAIEKERLKAIEEQRTAIQGNIDRYRQMHEANRSAIKEEENRNKSMAQRFGAMTDAQQQRIKDLAKAAKEAGGIDKLSRAEQEELRASGFADSAFTQIDLQRGQAAGAEQVFSDLGTFRPGTTDQAEGQGANETRMDYLKRERDAIAAAGAEQERKMAEFIKQNGTQVDKLIDMTTKMGDLTPVIQQLERMIEIYRNHLGQIEDDIKQLGFDIKQGRVVNRR